MSETLVIGGTGAMGSRVVQRLLAPGDATVRVLTRNPGSDQAQGLAAQAPGRVRLIAGDVNDADSLRTALSGADQVFCNTDFMSTRSATGEYRQGLAILDAASAAGVARFIWSSLDSAVSLTDGVTAVPHYDGKAAVAAHINLLRSEEMMQKEEDGWYSEHVSVLTTAPYFENFQLRLVPSPGPLADGRDGLTFYIPMGNGKYPLVGLDDIAWYAQHMFENWQSWGGRDLAIAGDSLTGSDIAATFERVTGIPTQYTPVPLGVLRESIPEIGHDFAAMFQFFQDRDLVEQDRDVARLRGIHPDLMTFEDWLRATQWDGQEVDVQKSPVRLSAG